MERSQIRVSLALPNPTQPADRVGSVVVRTHGDEDSRAESLILEQSRGAEGIEYGLQISKTINAELKRLTSFSTMRIHSGGEVASILEILPTGGMSDA